MKKITTIIFQPVFVILIAATIRVLPHIPNVTPIAAMALFGGAYLNKKYALILPLSAMVLADIFLGFSLMTPFIYGSFLLIGFLGLWLKNHKHPVTILIVCLFSSLLFFVVTNFAVWVLWDFYPKTFSGLIACFIAALPFFRNTVLGDLFYTGLFFGGYEGVLRIVKSNRFNAAKHV